LVAGSGVVISRAWDELIQLAEQLSIPVATSLGGKGSIPEDHPLSIGVVGKYSRKSANEIVMKSDLVVFIGSRVGAMVTDVYKVPKPGTPIIHIEVVFDLVVPVDVLVNRLELMLLLFVDAVEAFQLPVGLGMVDAA
jgi:thiamine pyrophosphate-dependent acetolactate synthase large subunit-like protein